ncbi:MAG: DUF5615 family PIN-like protein [Labilithrix sp.]|nr:DUF5615 family PIN-like protein [Labilithrix sp.]
MKLLLDENLLRGLPRRLLVRRCRRLSRSRRGHAQREDSEVLDRAFEEDRILVTANVADFERLAHARELHAGSCSSRTACSRVKSSSSSYDESSRG